MPVQLTKWISYEDGTYLIVLDLSKQTATISMSGSSKSIAAPERKGYQQHRVDNMLTKKVQSHSTRRQAS